MCVIFSGETRKKTSYMKLFTELSIKKITENAGRNEMYLKTKYMN